MKKIVLLLMFLIGFAFSADFKLEKGVSYSSNEPMELFLGYSDNIGCDIIGKNYVSRLGIGVLGGYKINGVISGVEIIDKLKLSWGDTADKTIFAKFEIGWSGIQEV